MVNLSSVADLQKEFDELATGFKGYHDDMQWFLDIYQNNVFYNTQPNTPIRKKVGVNLLEVFADKLWDYLSPFPKISVPAVPEDAAGSDKREKILLATHLHQRSALRWNRQMFDSTIMSCVITTEEFDFNEMCVKLKRIDPRRASWQKADANSDQIQTFWYVEPVTAQEWKRRYKREPSGEAMTLVELADLNVSPMDGIDYFSVITRMDDTTITKFGGGMIVQPAYKHLMGVHPFDIDFPIEIASYNKQGAFYLRKLESLQAEFNDYWAQRGNIVRKLGNPLVWGRGIKQKQFQPVKESMSLDGGFVGLTENGELGLLSIPETKMIDTALMDTFQRMKDKAGFPTATFGEVLGANTSGDALSMYFTPTTRMIDKFNVAHRAHLESVNAKILRLYDTFLPTLAVKKLYGYVPGGKLVQIPGQGEDAASTQMMRSFSVEFSKEDIAGNYNNVVTMNPVAPKDEIAYKKELINAANLKLISKQTFLNEWGFDSPTNEMAMLEQEMGNPVLNPDGTSKVLQAQASANALLNPAGASSGSDGQ